MRGAFPSRENLTDSSTLNCLSAVLLQAGLRWCTMTKILTQVKFTIDARIVSAFKAKCESEDVSMASVIARWMQTGQPIRAIKIKTDTRRHRREAVMEIIRLLDVLMEEETRYRDNIPEQFEQRIEAADNTCDQLADAITCLADAF